MSLFVHQECDAPVLFIVVSGDHVVPVERGRDDRLAEPHLDRVHRRRARVGRDVHDVVHHRGHLVHGHVEEAVERDVAGRVDGVGPQPVQAGPPEGDGRAEGQPGDGRVAEIRLGGEVVDPDRQARLGDPAADGDLARLRQAVGGRDAGVGDNGQVGRRGRPGWR